MTDFNDPRLSTFTKPEAGALSGGQPDAEQLRAAAAAGIRRVINLRPGSEDAGYDEAAAAAALDLDYQLLPIAGPQDLNADNVRKLDALLVAGVGTPTLIHCASGNRVGALMALRAAWIQGNTMDQALEIGRRWGLTKMEPAVRQLLG